MILRSLVFSPKINFDSNSLYGYLPVFNLIESPQTNKHLFTKSKTLVGIPEQQLMIPLFLFCRITLEIKLESSFISIKSNSCSPLDISKIDSPFAIDFFRDEMIFDPVFRFHHIHKKFLAIENQMSI